MTINFTCSKIKVVIEKVEQARKKLPLKLDILNNIKYTYIYIYILKNCLLCFTIIPNKPVVHLVLSGQYHQASQVNPGGYNAVSLVAQHNRGLQNHN